MYQNQNYFFRAIQLIEHFLIDQLQIKLLFINLKSIILT